LGQFLAPLKDFLEELRKLIDTLSSVVPNNGVGLGGGLALAGVALLGASSESLLIKAKEMLARNKHRAWRAGVIEKAGETALDQEGELVTPRGRASENTDWDQQKKTEISAGQYVDATLDLTAEQQLALKGGMLLKMNDGAAEQYKDLEGLKQLVDYMAQKGVSHRIDRQRGQGLVEFVIALAVVAVVSFVIIPAIQAALGTFLTWAILLFVVGISISMIIASNYHAASSYTRGNEDYVKTFINTLLIAFVLGIILYAIIGFAGIQELIHHNPFQKLFDVLRQGSLVPAGLGSQPIAMAGFPWDGIAKAALLVVVGLGVIGLAWLEIYLVKGLLYRGAKKRAFYGKYISGYSPEVSRFIIVNGILLIAGIVFCSGGYLALRYLPAAQELLGH
ncbi:hypothetical protein COX84_05180, partial [Candidatus Micrarchaeota archaeon CG_4_10_14_0_2_um_filter_49_7]